MAQGSDHRRQCIHIAAFQRDLHAVRQRRAHFGRRTKSCSPLGFRPAHFIASRRQTHHRRAAPPRQGAIGSPLKLNRDERRWGRPRQRPGRGVLLDPFPKQVRVDPVFERKSRYRNARLKTTRDKTLLRCCLVAPATVPTNKPDPQFLIFVCHHKVSTYFGGHLMHQSTQKQKVQGNSRLRINRKRVQRLMRVMGIEALVPRPGTSKAAPGHKIYPYLLRGVSITEANHVWASDITYIPMAQGFLYLVAIIDWASRAVLAWRLSNTMDRGFCIAALDEALARHGTPKIFNTDQGAQFTSAVFTGRLEAAGIAISMDGRGRFMDNIFIERLWRSIKYEEVHLNAYADGREARNGIGLWMNFYNHHRPHQAMNNQFPMAAWRAGTDRIEAARTVDMPLRLDNANALPTYPQQTQKQQEEAA